MKPYAFHICAGSFVYLFQYSDELISETFQISVRIILYGTAYLGTIILLEMHL